MEFNWSWIFKVQCFTLVWNLLKIPWSVQTAWVMGMTETNCWAKVIHWLNMYQTMLSPAITASYIDKSFQVSLPIFIISVSLHIFNLQVIYKFWGTDNGRGLNTNQWLVTGLKDLCSECLLVRISKQMILMHKLMEIVALAVIRDWNLINKCGCNWISLQTQNCIGGPLGTGVVALKNEITSILDLSLSISKIPSPYGL